MKILAIIPARSGSKGFPNKNIAKIDGITLLEMAVQTASNCNIIDDVYISTDSKEYEALAKKSGAQSLGLRPESLAGDTIKTQDVVLDLLNKLDKEYDYIVLLQPTSPIRNGEDIENMINSIDQAGADAAVSIVKLEEPHPHKLKAIDDNGYIKSFIDGTNSEAPRQSLPEAYSLNGAIYVVKYSVFRKEKSFLPAKTLPYIMQNSINVDTEEDFIFLEAMHKINKIKLFSS